jgi:serine/threonine protein kinase
LHPFLHEAPFINFNINQLVFSLYFFFITTFIMISGTLIDNLRIVDVLGKGAYGQVYLGRHEKENKLYAIKSLNHAEKNNRALERIEIGLHSRVAGHANIIQLKKVVRDENWTHIVMEYGAEGDLFTAITERDLYAGNHPLIRKVFLQLLDAVGHCHENNVYHRDLKPENILVFDGGRTVKLSDFGLATTNKYSRDFGCGSTFYYSPGKYDYITYIIHVNVLTQ